MISLPWISKLNNYIFYFFIRREIMAEAVEERLREMLEAFVKEIKTGGENKIEIVWNFCE